MAVSGSLAALQPIRQRHRRAFFLVGLFAIFLAGLLHRDSRRHLFGRVSCQAKLLQAHALGRNGGRDGFGFRHDGLAVVDAGQFAEMSISPSLYQTVQHCDLLRAAARYGSLLRAIDKYRHIMMMQRALNRSATAIAQATVFMSSPIFPLDRDPDWSKLTTIENESRAWRLAAPSREEHI